MGLWGLFATLFGVGVITKDRISDAIDDSKSRDRAERNGDSIYLVNGYSERYTKTGQKCTKEYAPNGHIYVNDLASGSRLEDLTETKNNAKQYDEMQKSRSKGWIFYRKTDWDTHVGPECNVWVSDKFPGYYRYYFNAKDYNCYVVEGELRDKISGRKGTKEVWPIKGGKSYYMDGTPRTDDEMKNRSNREARELAIKQGKRFYQLSGDVRYYGDVYSDKVFMTCFTDFSRYRYLQEAIKKTEERRIPHHEKTIIVEYYELVPGGERWNLDGTKFVD